MAVFFFVIGKPLGIFLFRYLAVALGIARLPEGVNWGAILGGGFLAGIGRKDGFEIGF